MTIPSRLQAHPIVRWLTLPVVFIFGFFMGSYWPASATFVHREKKSVHGTPYRSVPQAQAFIKNKSRENIIAAIPLENQLAGLRKVISEDETLRNRIIDRGGAGLLGLGVQDDFVIADDLANFMKLTEQQRSHMRERANQFLASVKTWEFSHSVVVGNEAGKLISYKLPAADANVSKNAESFLNDLKDTIGQRNYELIDSQITAQLAEFKKERIVTLCTPASEEGMPAYVLSVEWRDRETGASGSSDESGAVLGEIPKRWQHLFPERK